MKKIMNHIYSKQQQPTENTALIQRPPNARKQAKVFFTELINLLGNSIEAGGAFDSNWAQYIRAFRHCMPTEFECSRLIDIETSYIALAATAINISFQIAAKQIKEKHLFHAQLFISIWNVIIDVLEMNYFYLGFALFMHTIAIKGFDSNTYKEKAKTMHAIFWGAEVTPSIIFAFFSNTQLRNKLRELIVSNTPRGIVAKLFDAFFELLRGFAIVRYIIFGIEEFIHAFKPELNVFTSPLGMAARYVPSTAYGCYQCYQSWQQPPQIATNELIGTPQSWKQTIENCLTTLYFLLFTGFTLAETPANHRTILLTIYSALFLIIIGYACFSAKQASPENNSDRLPALLDNVHKTDTTLAENDVSENTQTTSLAINNEQTYERDKNSIRILTSANSSYDFIPSLPANIAEAIEEQNSTALNTTRKFSH